MGHKGAHDCLGHLDPWADKCCQTRSERNRDAKHHPLDRALYCSPCDTWVNGQAGWQVHKQGKKHKKNAEITAEWQKIDAPRMHVHFQQEKEQDEDEGWQKLHDVYGVVHGYGLPTDPDSEL